MRILCGYCLTIIIFLLTCNYDVHSSKFRLVNILLELVTLVAVILIYFFAYSPLKLLLASFPHLRRVWYELEAIFTPALAVVAIGLTFNAFSLFLQNC